MDDISDMLALGPTLRALRKNAGLTQAQLASAAGLSRQHLIGIERGQALNIELPTLIKLLDALGAQLTIRHKGRRTLNEILRDRQHAEDNTP